MKKKLMGMLLCTAIAVTALAGCKNSGTGTETQNVTNVVESQTKEEETTGKGAELTMWIFLNPNSDEDPRNVVLREIVEEYNATNTMGNTVTVESIHYSKLESQAIQAAAAKTGPAASRLSLWWTRAALKFPAAASTTSRANRGTR